MRIHLFVAICVAVLMLLLLEGALGGTQLARAGGQCQQPYTVQRGDTLLGIAQRFGVSYSELVRLNRRTIANPNRIVVGQVLCLPVPPTDTEPVRINSNVVLEVVYQYSPSDDEQTLVLARGGLIGKRVVYPLQPIEPVQAFSETREITAALHVQPAPVLVGIRSPSLDRPTYTLVTIGRPDILSSLGISASIPITENMQGLAPLSVREVLTGPGVKSVALTLLLEEDSGLRFPFRVEKLDAVPDFVRFKQYYMGVGKDEQIGFALFAAGADRYRLVIRFSGEGFGPPGVGRRQRCDGWRRSGWFFRFLRSFYGC